MNRVLVANTPLGDTWWATSLEGKEELSSLYEFRLELKSEKADIDTQSLIGETCSVTCEGNRTAIRYFSGHIVNAASKGKSGKYWLYELWIAPKLWYASRRADYRIFQDQTVQDIANQVLQDNAINYEWRLKNGHRSWEYVVQYGETDLAFLLRLLGNEGIYFWFEHTKNGEKLILGDHFTVHEPFPGYKDIPYYAPDVSRVEEDHFNAWRARRAPESGKFVHTDYDFKSPSKDLKTESTDQRGHLFDQYEVFAYPGAYAESEHGQEYAAARLQGMQVEQDTIVLKGSARGAIPGCCFTLKKHPVQKHNRDFLITKAKYRAQNSDYESSEDAESKEAYFHVKASAMPADRQYCAPREKFKMPRTYGPDTAVVVGPEGSEIHTDEYGRVKVHFHWDRYGQKDGKDSCWIRVSYPWAGSNFGSIHIPRVGQEVIIDYEHGDPQRPLIIGRVYNAQQMPPWDLPTNKTQSGTLTRSSTDGSAENFNAMRFEDAKGKEEMWLHAERDRKVDVKNDDTTWIGNDRTRTVDGNETITIHKDRTKTVDGTETSKILQNKAETIMLASVQSVGAARMDNVGAAYNLNVGLLMGTVVGDTKETTVMQGDQTVTVCAGNQTVTVNGDQTITSETGDQTITAATGDQAISAVAGSQTLTAKTGQTMTALTGGQTFTSVMGDQSVTVQLGNQTITANMGIQTITGMLGQTILALTGDQTIGAVTGDQYTSASKKINTSAGESITLSCGTSSIEITQSSIILRAGNSSLMLNESGVTVNGVPKIYLNC